MTVERLKKKYYGDKAERYASRRENTDKWNKEHAAVESMLARYSGAAVLDLPCGTGRFMEVYRRLGCSVIAADVSTDMLKEARKAAERAEFDGARFETVDALAMNPGDFQADVVVSIRFMNWLSPEHARQAFANLCACSRKAIIIGIRSIDLEMMQGELRRKAQRRLLQARRPRPDERMTNYLHLKDDVNDWFRVAGLLVRSSQLIEKTQIGADYVVYELERA
jgi:SAM-dependent methyltransferase